MKCQHNIIISIEDDKTRLVCDRCQTSWTDEAVIHNYIEKLRIYLKHNKQRDELLETMTALQAEMNTILNEAKK